MYSKALVNNEFLYFVHAPPQSPLDTAKQKLPKLPYPEAPRHENSVYYYWWAFLRLNKGYIDCCRQNGRGPFNNLYADFGDVRDGQRTLDEYGEFKAWWSEIIEPIKGKKMPRCKYLFAEPERTLFVEKMKNADATFDQTNFVYLSIPLRADLEETMKDIRQIMQPRFESYRKEHGHFSQARYKAHAKYDTNHLYQVLQTRLEKMRDPHQPHVEIAKTVGIVINKKFENIRNLERDLSQRVNEYLEEAKALIHNVGLGRFPDDTLPGTARKRAGIDEIIDWENM